ncbi:DUF1566 domain-containing protein [Polynucleobacter sp. JS-Fieb-80-E5]|uniref:DUF1566 domain-containing protein n=1 Tax=Polynucleobacter sp. JS-Fieb-80-E5 TaxID=2081050 RepID=UPI001C0BADFA|nr:DUF1566 domain-containing protein [Polynucleobacter sp. JS-Fieb-80-E5]MBU3618628.1 DUF1566 domain-containing protein [Polynucleobacter sp. JS-Fieb-80-E5]
MVASFSALITGCGGGSSDTSSQSIPTPTPSTTTYTIGGSVSGLNGSLTIKNNATDQSIITSSGQFTFDKPVSQGGQYNVTITAQPNTQTCTLSNYSGTNVNENITTILIICTNNPPSTTSLSLSTTTLALATSGTPRIVIVTNTGQVSASTVNFSANPVLPYGTTSASTCGGTLTAGSSCTITITPGSAASASASAGTAAVPSTLAISGSNTNSLDANIYVLTYGSIYQSGYIFSIDDSPSATNNIGGKVLALSSQPTSSYWSTTDNNIPGITETDTSPCNGANHGRCDTTQIVSYYTALSVPYGQYAAGLCKSTISGYGDWYLPSICEMNNTTSLVSSSCNPATQDIQSKLVNTGIVPLTNYFWSSTEVSFNPASVVWVNYFDPFGGSVVNGASKTTALASVRCTRALTN